MEGIQSASFLMMSCANGGSYAERVIESPYLKLPDDLELRLAIGLFISTGIRIPA